jgi:transcriptional regulator with XRE-family HTH domain
MAKRFQRVFRDRPLTPEEFATDEETRSRVQREFPPLRSKAASSPDSLSSALRQAIRGSDRSVYRIAMDAGVSQIVISRFLSGERDIRMATADKLAETLGLKLAARG